MTPTPPPRACSNESASCLSAAYPTGGAVRMGMIHLHTDISVCPESNIIFIYLNNWMMFEEITASNS